MTASPALASHDIVIASSTAKRPKRVVNSMIEFMATDDVSLKGSPTTDAAWNSVPSDVHIRLRLRRRYAL